jgi:hypothetical protein
MGNLFLSFTIAICVAVGFMSVSRAFDVEFYTNKTLPLIPILYAVVYEALEHRKTGATRTSPPVHRKKVATAETLAGARGITLERVLMGMGVSFAVKFLIEMFLVVLFLRFSGQSFSETYGPFSIETVGRFLRGDHPWFSGNEGILLLSLLAMITCFITGLWIGYTSEGRAILEGVLAGAAVTIIMSMTNMLILYRKIETATENLAGSMGYAMRTGFLVVLLLQVLLYGLWSGVVQMGKADREKQRAEKKAGKRSKK